MSNSDGAPLIVSEQADILPLMTCGRYVQSDNQAFGEAANREAGPIAHPAPTRNGLFAQFPKNGAGGRGPATREMTFDAEPP